MSLKIVVLAKQVPDTRNVGKDAMKADGTINRAALPAIFNPEDLNALEQALRIKDAHPGSTVTLLTMGPARAADIIREGLFRGADRRVSADRPRLCRRRYAGHLLRIGHRYPQDQGFRPDRRRPVRPSTGIRLR